MKKKYWGICAIFVFGLFALELGSSGRKTSAADTEVVEKTVQAHGENGVIKAKAYANDQKITRVDVAEGVTTIGKRAFYNCKNLKMVLLPKSIKKIESKAFIGCSPQLFVGIFSSMNKKARDELYQEEIQYGVYGINDGLITHHTVRITYYQVGDNFNKNNLMFCVTKKSDTKKEVCFIRIKRDKAKVNIPNQVTAAGKTYQVTEIRKKALSKSQKLSQITIGKNVKKINAKAFYKCTKLKKIIIKNSNCKYVGKNIFKKIAKNIKVYVPKKGFKKHKSRLKKAGILEENIKVL